MTGFVIGIITGVLVTLVAVSLYGLVKMAGEYERSIESWFDEK